MHPEARAGAIFAGTTGWINRQSRRRSEHHRAVSELTRFVVAAVDAARVKQEPFFHLEFDRVFPDDIYRAMLEADAADHVVPAAAVGRTTSCRTAP